MAAHSMFFLEGLRSLCADKPQQKSGLSATFFLHTKKEGKDVSGGIAPWTPSGLPAIFRGKPAVARLPESTIKKGCRPKGLGGHNFMHFI